MACRFISSATSRASPPQLNIFLAPSRHGSKHDDLAKSPGLSPLMCRFFQSHQVVENVHDSWAGLGTGVGMERDCERVQVGKQVGAGGPANLLGPPAKNRLMGSCRCLRFVCGLKQVGLLNPAGRKQTNLQSPQEPARPAPTPHRVARPRPTPLSSRVPTSPLGLFFLRLP